MKITKEDIICIIPARGGSKGLPRKNVKLINNEPLIVRPIRQAIESKIIGTILVTTDDEEIANLDNCKVSHQVANGVGLRMAVLAKLFSEQ